MKKCIECEETKDKTNFYTNRAMKDELDSLCKDCRRGRNAEWNSRNPNYQRDYYFRVTKPRRQAEARRKRQGK